MSCAMLKTTMTEIAQWKIGFQLVTGRTWKDEIRRCDPE
jgi:hypothetical protein